jgi:hypothetical protein
MNEKQFENWIQTTQIERIDKFEDLIEEISKFGVNLGQNYKKLKSKDRNEYAVIL